MEMLVAWYLIGVLSAVLAAWRTHELFTGFNWAYCLMAGVFGPLLWIKPAFTWIKAHSHLPVMHRELRPA